MDRYTYKDAEKCFERLLTALGKRRAKRYNDVGGWTLNYNPIYGGVVIYEIANTGGGVSEPIISNRLTPKEFCYTVNFTIRAIEAMRRR